jgi:hypothetical protein
MWEIDYKSTTGGLNFTTDDAGSSLVTVTAVHEPATLVLVTAATGLAAILRRRRA